MGELKDTVKHRTSKYLNNRIEADHGALKRLIRPTRGFQSMKTAYATIKGFEVMRMIRRRHCMLIEPGITGEVRFVNKLFDLARIEIDLDEDRHRQQNPCCGVQPDLRDGR